MTTHLEDGGHGPRPVVEQHAHPGPTVSGRTLHDAQAVEGRTGRGPTVAVLRATPVTRARVDVDQDTGLGPGADSKR